MNSNIWLAYNTICSQSRQASTQQSKPSDCIRGKQVDRPVNLLGRTFTFHPLFAHNTKTVTWMQDVKLYDLSIAAHWSLCNRIETAAPSVI